MKGISKDKFCKGTDIPKRSGNFSPMRMHFQQREYPMERNKDGLMIIGTHTPACCYLPMELLELMGKDRFFKNYRREGVYKHGGKEYKCYMEIYKTAFSGYGMPDYKFRMCIDTERDFEFEFPEL